MKELLITASSYAHAGLSVIPTAADKRPACAWKPFTERIMSDRELEVNFRNAGGIGIVCGKVSGNLELLDFDDGGSRFAPWLEKVPRYIRDRLVVEQSPSGGKHVFYRVGTGDSGSGNGYGVPGNRKLAMKADGHVLIETRGEGGYVKCAPSEGYVLEQGDFQHVPTISPLEENVLIEIAQSFDEKNLNADRLRDTQKEAFSDVATTGRNTDPTPQSKNALSASMGAGSSNPHSPFPNPLTPWDDYNERGDLASLLERHGWKRVKSGDNEHWERPGKDDRSTSATWNGTVFYVFSSNAWGFEPNKGYNKFQVYAALECGGDKREAARKLRSFGYGRMGFEKVKVEGEGEQRTDSPCSGGQGTDRTPPSGPFGLAGARGIPTVADGTVGAGQPTLEPTAEFEDPGALPEELLQVPGFVGMLMEHTLSCAPYPNKVLAFAGALTMLAHLSGRNYRDPRNLRTNLYLLALADSGVGKDFPRKVNMNLATEIGIMGGMADRFASAEGLEDALLIRPCSFFQVDEVDTLFASLAEHGDSAMEKIYGALLQFATSADTTFAMRKKAIQQTGGKAGKFDKVRARGIREPHLTLLGTAIPKYLFSAVSERALENGLLSRCLVIEAGERGNAGNPHFEPFKPELLDMARQFVAHGGFEGLDLEKLDEEPPPYVEPYTVSETEAAVLARSAVTEQCEVLYHAAKTTAEKALWTRGAEKTSKLALLYALSENPAEPIISDVAVDWGWRVVEHLTRRLLFQASIYVHDNEFDALRQKSIRYLRDYGGGSLNHGQLLRYLHIDADTFRRVIDTLVQSELISVQQLSRGGFRYTLV